MRSSVQHPARSLAISSMCLPATTVFAWEKVGLTPSDTVPETDIRSATLSQEFELGDFYMAKGLKVYVADKAAFRSHVLQEYKNSKFLTDWPAGLREKIDTF